MTNRIHCNARLVHRGVGRERQRAQADDTGDGRKYLCTPEEL